MKRNTGFKLVITAMFASMVCVSTLCIQLPSPMGGYVNLGDVLVLMSAFLLGRKYGSAAAGIGSALADLFSSYAYYAPGTFIIKAAVALTAALLAEKLPAKLPQTLRRILAGAAGEILMVLGYLFYAWVCLSYGAAAVASVPGNIAQAAVGIAVAVILTPLISRPCEIQEMLSSFHDPE